MSLERDMELARESVKELTNEVVNSLRRDSDRYNLELDYLFYLFETEYYGTNHEGDEYTISEYDLEDFSKFLSDEFPDLCLIRCCFGTGDACIWFYRKDLEEAVFY